EPGFSMITLAAGAYVTGMLLDHGVSPRAVALGTGLFMLLPAAAWAWALRLWNERRPTVSLQSADYSLARYRVPRHRRASLRVQLIYFRSHDEIALGEPVDLVSPERQLNPAPGQQDVGMMAL